MAKSHIPNRASGVSTLQAMLTHQKLCLVYVIWPYFTVFYYFNLMKYFANVMGSH